MKKETAKILILLTIFSIAMGFLEGAVVVYLRKLYYPQGFNFPLQTFFDPFVIGVEWVRELATIIMLITLALLLAKKYYLRWAYFLYSFAVWDIFYYVFLKLALDWPLSLLDWDILFLIPLPWLGPVLAPLLCTLLFIMTTVIILHLEDLKRKIFLTLTEKVLIISGGAIILYTWLFDYAKLIITGGFITDFFTLADNKLFYQTISNFIPPNYNWPLFILGFTLGLAGICLFWRRTGKLWRRT